MEPRELLFVAFAGAILRGALFAQPPNVTYFIDKESCSLQVMWLSAEPPNSSPREYEVTLRINGTWVDKSKRCLKTTYWKAPVPLGKEIGFKVERFCNNTLGEDGAFHVVQNGTPGTGARNVSCTWRNRNYMECLWWAGEKASPDTSYKLFHRYDDLDKGQQCRNFTREGSVFRCGFEWTIQHASVLIISIQGNSGNIQPSCFLFDSINSLVKLDPPVITHVSRNASRVLLNWTKPANLYDLSYQVEIDSEEVRGTFENTGSGYITVQPNVQHTFRVRVKSREGPWSDWSNMVSDGGIGGISIFTILLFILIPLCVALVLVILLIYLKRIKLLILPKIPDPEKILKHTFEDYNENQPTYEAANNEETHSLMIVEPAGNEK